MANSPSLNRLQLQFPCFWNVCLEKTFQSSVEFQNQLCVADLIEFCVQGCGGGFVALLR